jgi:hypothetical protein
VNAARLILCCALALSGCTDSSATIRTLESAGFSDITVTGYAFFQCGEDDTSHTGFRAKNPSGKYVEGTVCCGLVLKGCTVRF